MAMVAGAGRHAVGAVRASVHQRLRRLQDDDDFSGIDPVALERAVNAAADVFAAELTLGASGSSLLAQRIGPVYTVEDLSRWLRPAADPPLTGEAVRKRAKLGQLVAFLSDDRQWAFPAWQFTRTGGRLIVLADVVQLWKQLPSGFLTDVDRAAWMSTRLGALEGLAPAAYARRFGADAEALQAAVARLRARVS